MRSTDSVDPSCFNARMKRVRYTKVNNFPGYHRQVFRFGPVDNFVNQIHLDRRFVPYDRVPDESREEFSSLFPSLHQTGANKRASFSLHNMLRDHYLSRTRGKAGEQLPRGETGSYLNNHSVTRRLSWENGGERLGGVVRTEETSGAGGG